MNIQQNLTIRLLRVLRYNKARCERAVELLPPEKKPMFHVIPFLLHINHPKFPGYVDDLNTPYGLVNYSLRDDLLEALKITFPENIGLLEDIKQIWPKRRLIDSLVLMGSIGTIAQSKSSDFDYWVCFEGEKLPEGQQLLLNQKLQLIEEWADQFQDMEVHFFPSNIDAVRQNDFGVADGESSGSAQAIFLKAEFYTTNIVVAGKAPFWWLMPEKTTDAQYQDLINIVKGGDSPEPKWFMDLGNLEKMDPNEIFGAAIWQISKAMDSPFKSVLKMAKLEVFLENIEQKQPLCNLLKKRVHNGSHAPGDVEHIDPYALMFDELLEYYSATENKSIVPLLQLCLYLKCDVNLSIPVKEGANSFKRQIVRGYVQKWGWTRERIKKVDRIKHWNFQELSQLSKQIHSFLIMCYRRISAKIDPERQTVSQEDMTVLGRKIDAFYTKKDFKIDYLRSAFDNELYCHTITIKADMDKTLKRKWSIYRGNQINSEDSTLENVRMKTSYNPIDLIVWGVSNKILDSKTKILLGYKTEPVVEEDLYRLARFVRKYFPPIKVSEISRNDLLQPSRIINCMAVVNFESRRFKPDIESIRVIYSNSWGEVYCLDSFEELKKINLDLFDEKLDPKPETLLLVPEGSHEKRLKQDFASKSKMSFDFL